MQDKNGSEEVLTIRIGCEQHDVDAEAVISLMQATVNLIQTANRTVYPKDTLQVKVSPFVPGSFEILFNLIVPSVVLLEKAPIIASTLSICKDYLSIRKWLHGTRQPGKIEPGINMFGDQKFEVNAETVNVYQNCQVKQDFSRAFTCVQKDDSIKEVEIYKGRKKEELLINIPIAHFVDYIEPDNVELEISPKKKENSFHTTVTIHTPVLAGRTKGNMRSKWKVIYNNRVISVDIRDEDFRQKVESTIYRFGVGDRLDVDMIEKKIFNTEVDEYIVDSKGYIITDVWNHIPGKKKASPKVSKRVDQKTLFEPKKKPKKK